MVDDLKMKPMSGSSIEWLLSGTYLLVVALICCRPDFSAS